MRLAKIPMTVLLLAAPAWIGAQPARPATGAPEVFSAAARAKNASGEVSGTLEIRVTRYTPESDRTAVETALRLGGYIRFVPALRKAPEVGELVVGGQPYAIRYAREKVEAGGRTIVLVTDKAVFFVGAGRPDAKPRTGYEVAIVQIQLDGTGKGHGTMAGAARVRPDGDGGVLLDDYADEPIELSNVVRKAS